MLLLAAQPGPISQHPCLSRHQTTAALQCSYHTIITNPARLGTRDLLHLAAQPAHNSQSSVVLCSIASPWQPASCLSRRSTSIPHRTYIHQTRHWRGATNVAQPTQPVPNSQQPCHAMHRGAAAVCSTAIPQEPRAPRLDTGRCCTAA